MMDQGLEKVPVDEELGGAVVEVNKEKGKTFKISNQLKFFGVIGAVVLFAVVLLVVVISLSVNVKGSAYHEYQEKFCDKVGKYARTRRLEGTGFNRTPEVNDINRCRKPADCDFEVLSCSSPCPLGYTMEDGCPVSCECAKQGTMQLDVQFDEDTVPALIQQMSDEPSADFVVFSPQSGIMPWKQDIVNGRPRIPYVFSEDLRLSQREAAQVAFGILRDTTCIDFVPRFAEPDYLFIQNGDGDCSASYSRHPGKNDLNIESCYSSSHILHVLMHSLGFHHEHMREDRDAYINILWDNVDPVYESAFSKLNPSNYVVSEFDIKSIMMLDGFAFSKNEERTDPTMINIDTNKTVIGGGLVLTSHDIEDIEETYCRATPNFNTPEAAVTGILDSAEDSSPESRYDSVFNSDLKTVVISGIEINEDEESSQESESEVVLDSESEAAEVNGSEIVSDEDLTPSMRMTDHSYGSTGGLTIEVQYDDYTMEWSQWSRCHITCGGGSIQTRVQECKAEYCGSDPKKETKTCKTELCPRKVLWSEWEEWGSCSKKCGGGIRYRYKKCLENCEGEVKPTEAEKCNQAQCKSAKPEFTPWSTWTPCAATCGPSKRLRTRSCRDTKGRTSFQCEGRLKGASSFEMGIGQCNMGPCVNKVHYPIDTGVVIPPKKELLKTHQVFDVKSKNISKEHCDTLPNFYWFLGDFNGDGRTDTMCGEDVNILKVFLLNADESYTYVWKGRFNCAIDFMYVGDFNGDGTDDIFCKGSLLSINYVYRTMRNKDMFKPSLAVGSFCLNVKDTIQILDVNGDKKSDIICRHDDSKDDTDIYLSTLSS